MSDRLAPRLTSLALAALVTWSLVAGIDTMALGVHADALQMSRAAAASQTAMLPRAPRS